MILWLDCRAFQNKQENNGYILMTGELKLQYDKLKATVTVNTHHVPVNDPLRYWHQVDNRTLYDPGQNQKIYLRMEHSRAKKADGDFSINL